MTGKLKTRGNIMLATKLDNVLKVRSWFLILSIIDVILHHRAPRQSCKCQYIPPFIECEGPVLFSSIYSSTDHETIIDNKRVGCIS